MHLIRVLKKTMVRVRARVIAACIQMSPATCTGGGGVRVAAKRQWAWEGGERGAAVGCTRPLSRARSKRRPTTGGQTKFGRGRT